MKRVEVTTVAMMSGAEAKGGISLAIQRPPRAGFRRTREGGGEEEERRRRRERSELRGGSKRCSNKDPL